MIKCTISAELLNRVEEEIKQNGFEEYWKTHSITKKTFEEYIVFRALKAGYKNNGSLNYLQSDLSAVNMEQVLIQKTFEPDAGNCTLMAITSLLTHLEHTDPYAMYSKVRRIARFFLYTKRTGTPPMFTAPITNRASKARLKITQSFGLGKSVCYKGSRQPLDNFIHGLGIRLMDSQIPAIITIKNASYGRYKMHSMLVVGVYEVAIPTDGPMQVTRFLIVHDGWSGELVYLPADELGIFQLLEFQIK